jgi:hypothetical protein
MLSSNSLVETINKCHDAAFMKGYCKSSLDKDHVQFTVRPDCGCWVRIDKNQIDGAIIHGITTSKDSLSATLLQVTLIISKPKDQLGQSLVELLRLATAGGGDPVGI